MAPSETLFEVDEEDFRRCWWRRRKLHIKWLSIIGAVVLPFVLLWSTVSWGINAREVGALIIVEPVLIGIALLKGSEYANLNRFCILADRIAPPRRPKSLRGSRNLAVVPFESIEHVEYKKVGSGLFPNSHYGAVLHMRDGEEFEFDATEIYAQTRWKEEEVAEAQLLLEDLAIQLNAWRLEGKKEEFRFRPSERKG